MVQHNPKKFYTSGTVWMLFNAIAAAICICMVISLLVFISFRGLSFFWPADIAQITYFDKNKDKVTVIGEIVTTEEISIQKAKQIGIALKHNNAPVKRYLVKVGNKDITGTDFIRLTDSSIVDISYPKDLFVAQRTEWGNLYGSLSQVITHDKKINLDAGEDYLWDTMHSSMMNVHNINSQIKSLTTGDLEQIFMEVKELAALIKKLKKKSGNLSKIKLLEQKIILLHEQASEVEERIVKLKHTLDQDYIVVKIASVTSDTTKVAVKHIMTIYQPNKASFLGKLGFYFKQIGDFLSDNPRESNTEGGVLPAIFGTVVMVLLMTLVVSPLGIIAAIYICEYAGQGFLINLVRIAIHNLAGVPSIVYGIFGLGFFVYFIGGNIDDLFFSDSLPTPTFGTSGLLWASLTLSLLTLPVVIAAAEEGLTSIPRQLRESSLALGATKAETIWRVILPIARPAMMTGIILAIARAAGEVAPLVLVGVVKLAPTLPIDGQWPFIHLEQKFMHLGFHIYDVAFQSPNIEASRPLVYATSFLLVAIIVILNLFTFIIRNRLREKYKALES